MEQPKRRYARNMPALSAEECARLLSKRACVLGCGGLGGHIVELLARAGLGAITAVDGDVFDETNLNRQLLSQESLLGQSKALAARDRVAQINADVDVQPVETFLTADNADAILAGCHIAMDALDSVPARRILAAACDRLGIPLVHGAVSGWMGQVSVILPGSGAMDRLYPTDPEKDGAPGVLSFTPALCASIQAAEAVKLLVGRRSELAGRLLLFDLAGLETYMIEI